MARRIRSIKPDFFTSPDVTGVEFRTRLTWIGLWTYCDDFGRESADIDLIKAAVWPKDRKVQPKQVADDLAALAARRMIGFYTVDGRDYLQVINWRKHQRVDRPTKSNVPEPSGELRASLARDSRVLQPDSGGEGEGKGRDKEGEATFVAEAPFCKRHPKGTTESCRACGDARRRWEASRNAAEVITLPPRSTDPEFPEHEHRWLADGTCMHCTERKGVTA